jgi:DNA-binding response OmpR family regulator
MTILKRGPMTMEVERGVVYFKGKRYDLRKSLFEVLRVFLEHREGQILSAGQVGVALEKVMSSDNMAQHVCQLNLALGEKVVKSRRGFGYHLDLEDEEASPTSPLA